MIPTACVLPSGYFDAEGFLQTQMELAPLSGQEEEMLSGTGAAPAAELVTRVLARCVRRAGGDPIGEELAREMLVGDRQYLLLQLRALTFGDRVAAKISCPWPQCGQAADVDFRISDITIPRYEGVALHEMNLSVEAMQGCSPEPGSPLVEFRLPRGRDQEEIAPLVEANEAAALRRLLELCVTKLGGCANPPAEWIHGLSARARREIEHRMEELSPGLELIMDVKCPECERPFQAPFDVHDFFFGELKTSRELLYREVHYLAYHYHWGEQEIMDMPREKRRKYIEVLADEVERINSAAH
jgi:hypothetical protein